MYKYVIFLFFSIILLGYSSCGDNETETLDNDSLGYTYVPLEVGKYWIYKSDSLVIKQNGMARDSLSGFIKEEVTDTFLDASNLKTYRLERFFKRNLSDNWGEPRVWTSSRTATNYIRTEENLKFVKLAFPPDLNTTWDGNAFIDESIKLIVGGEEIEPFKGFWDYRVDSTDLKYVYEEINLDDVIKIQHVDDEDFLEKRYSEERYAKDVGLVYQKKYILDTQCGTINNPPCEGDSFEDYAYHGFVLELQLIEHN